MTINAAFVVFASTFISILTRKFKPITNIGLAGILYGLGFGMIFFIKSFPMFIISTIIWTTGEILAAVNTNVFLSEHSPISHRGRFNSIRLFVRRAGMAFGPLFAGFLIKSSGLKNIWGYIFLLAVCASIGVFVLYYVENILLNKDRDKIQVNSIE
jgi:MFS family permease